MMNNSILIGRIVKTPELRETEKGKKVTNITIAVSRSFKNVNGEYDTDFIECTLWDNIAITSSEYCKKGDLIALKGRLQSNLIEITDDKKMNIIQFIVERLTFLSTTKNSDKKETNCID